MADPTDAVEALARVRVGDRIGVTYRTGPGGFTTAEGEVVDLNPVDLVLAAHGDPIRRAAITEVEILSMRTGLEGWRFQALRAGDLIRVTYDPRDAPEPQTVVGTFTREHNRLLNLARDTDGAMFQVPVEDVLACELITAVGPFPHDRVVFDHSPLTLVFYGGFGTAYAWSGDPTSPRPDVANMGLVDRAAFRALAESVIADLDGPPPF
jgi:hypothetical protein